MKVLLVADIHANLTAFEAVLADAESADGFDRMWMIGDVVGYGPDPNECADRVREAGALGVAGNHDLAAVGAVGVEVFNPYARAAVRWTAEHLSPESVEYVMALPQVVEDSGWTVSHGVPSDPVWGYLLTVRAAVEGLAHFTTRGCVIGHSHSPVFLRMGPDAAEPVGVAGGGVVEVGSERCYVNPGAVGQPRDGDPRASYALLDTDADVVEFRRVAYDIEATQRRMVEAGLPWPLIERLAHGR